MVVLHCLIGLISPKVCCSVLPGDRGGGEVERSVKLRTELLAHTLVGFAEVAVVVVVVVAVARRGGRRGESIPLGGDSPPLPPFTATKLRTLFMGRWSILSVLATPLPAREGVGLLLSLPSKSACSGGWEEGEK